MELKGKGCTNAQPSAALQKTLPLHRTPLLCFCSVGIPRAALDHIDPTGLPQCYYMRCLDPARGQPGLNQLHSVATGLGLNPPPQCVCALPFPVKRRGKTHTRCTPETLFIAAFAAGGPEKVLLGQRKRILPTIARATHPLLGVGRRHPAGEDGHSTNDSTGAQQLLGARDKPPLPTQVPTCHNVNVHLLSLKVGVPKYPGTCQG